MTTNELTLMNWVHPAPIMNVLVPFAGIVIITIQSFNSEVRAYMCCSPGSMKSDLGSSSSAHIMDEFGIWDIMYISGYKMMVGQI